MKVKYFFQILFLLTVFIFQFSFLSASPDPVNSLNLILVILVYILLLFGKESAIVAGIAWGAFLDAFSYLPFGINLLGLFAVLAFASYLLLRFFTNRSLYSLLAVVTLATILNFILINLFVLIFDFMHIFERNLILMGNLKTLAYQIGMNALMVILLFYVTNFISRKFKPVFIEENRK